jgi:putative ABC transport system permease protein
VLACLGIYGVLAFTTARRTSEIGIRMALGARPGQILRAIITNGMTPVFGGIAVGLVLSAALARVVESLLFQVRAFNPPIYTGTALVLLIVAVLACFLPARRAARLNPVEALRHE